MAAVDFRLVARVALSALLIAAWGCGPSGSSSSTDVADTTDAQADAVTDVAFPRVYCESDEQCQRDIPTGVCGTVVCQLPAGVCVVTAGPDGLPCDDQDRCTVADQCLAGRCQGTARACNDGNPCTTDGCEPATGCVFEAVDGGACDDGNPCTPSSSCVMGVCAAGANECACDLDEDCVPFDDDDRCNGVLTCQQGGCALAEGSVVTCDTTGDSACRKTRCDPEVGACFAFAEPLGQACDDGDGCTEGDACVNGRCRGITALDCDDGNPCTTDFCESDKGCVYLYNNAPCDDGDRCTLGDRCDFGQCLAGQRFCECGADADCATTAGSGPCLGTFTCESDGFCHRVAGSATVCPKAEPGSCVTYACDEDSGACVERVLPDGAPCDDDDVCTKNDRCQMGTCVGGAPPACTDNDPCTGDSCQHPYGCVFDAEASNLHTCSDGNFCTGGEVCRHGVCIGSTNVCECFEAADCARHEDGNACNGTLTCRNNQCVVDASTVVVCGGALQNSCVRVACNPESGQCEAEVVPDGTACEDGDRCTTVDSCVGGTCTAGEEVSCVSGNPCRVGYCNAKVGCVYTFRSGPCSDGDPCTAGDICSSGACVGTRRVNCEDGEGCTADSCASGEGCVHLPFAAACDDGDACSTFDTCTQGRCAGSSPLHCDDGNPCTADACGADGACTHQPAAGPCDDGNGCTTGDACQAGACVPGAACEVDSAVACEILEDGDPCNGTLRYDTVLRTCVPEPATVITCSPTGTEPACTTTACDPVDGACRVRPLSDGTACDDGDRCTENDRCEAGACDGGDPISCEDGQVCTDDTCDPQTGCQHTPNAVVCDDGDYCTVYDYCFDGACIGGPRLCDCTDDVDCELVDDGDRCNGRYVCRDNACVFDEDSVVFCDPSHDTACTRNACDPGTGGCRVVNLPNGRRCDDGDACTLDDACQAGACVGAPRSCKDANACTADSCDPAAGCRFTPVSEGTPCDDTNACTTADFCRAGVCVGAWRACDDGNPCTVDRCDVAVEAGDPCRHEPVPEQGLCDDGDVCTKVSICVGGACLTDPAPANQIACDDGNPCTADTCDPLIGCVYAPLDTGDCTAAFGSGCVLAASCRKGVCTPMQEKACDDGKACTADACDDTTGACTHQALAQGTPCPASAPCVAKAACDANGACVQVPLDCGPSPEECATMGCNPQTGACTLTPRADGLPCALDDPCAEGSTCEAGTCHLRPKPCDVTDARCQVGFCNALGGGCEVLDMEGPCDDGDPCTVNDTCVQGACQSGSELACATSGPCESAYCDPTQGACVNQPLADGVPCEDGNPCTASSTCQAGLCVGAWDACDDGIVCTRDACDPLTGACVHDEVAAACDDGSPCTDDLCASGAAGAHASTGCVHAPVAPGGPCNDQDPCTLDEVCDPAGLCVGAPACDDDNPCTLDLCSSEGVCSQVASGRHIPCAVGGGLACRLGDRCDAAGDCVEGGYDACGAVVGDVGCVGQPQGTICDDGDPETAGDTCLIGSCRGFKLATSTLATAFADVDPQDDQGKARVVGQRAVAGLDLGVALGAAAAAGELTFGDMPEALRGAPYRRATMRLAAGEGRLLTFLDHTDGYRAVETDLIPYSPATVTGLLGQDLYDDGGNGAWAYLLAGGRGTGDQPWSRRCRYDYQTGVPGTGVWSCQDQSFDLSAGSVALANVRLGPLAGGFSVGGLSHQIDGADVVMAARALTGTKAMLFLGHDASTHTWKLEHQQPVAGLVPEFEAVGLARYADPVAPGISHRLAMAVGTLATAWWFDGQQWVAVAPWPAGFPGADTQLVRFRGVVAVADPGGVGRPGFAMAVGERLRLDHASSSRVDGIERFLVSWQVDWNTTDQRFVLSSPALHLLAFEDVSGCADVSLDERWIGGLRVIARDTEATIYVPGARRVGPDGACLPAPEAALWWASLPLLQP